MHKPVALGWRLLAAFVVISGGLLLATLVGELASAMVEELTWMGRQVIQALVMSGVVIPLIIVLRRRLDHRPLAGIGFESPGRALRFFLLGLAPPLVVLALPLIVISALGWAEVRVDLARQTLAFVLAWMAIAFFYEAFPEEVVLRGYVYRNLSAAMARWLAALTSVGIFVLVPVTVVFAYGALTGGSLDVGGQDRLTADYLLLIVAFGCLLAYIRVVTGSVWACIGFHLGFLQIGRLLGTGDGALIVITEPVADAGPVDQLFLITAVVVLLVILAYPLLGGRRPGWLQRDPENVDREQP